MHGPVDTRPSFVTPSHTVPIPTSRGLGQVMMKGEAIDWSARVRSSHRTVNFGINVPYSGPQEPCCSVAHVSIALDFISRDTKAQLRQRQCTLGPHTGLQSGAKTNSKSIVLGQMAPARLQRRHWERKWPYITLFIHGPTGEIARWIRSENLFLLLLSFDILHVRSFSAAQKSGPKCLFLFLGGMSESEFYAPGL